MKEIPASRRASIEAAVVAGGKHASQAYEAWIAADARRGGVKILITGPDSFERLVTLAADEEPGMITERVREALND